MKSVESQPRVARADAKAPRGKVLTDDELLRSMDSCIFGRKNCRNFILKGRKTTGIFG